MCRHATAITAIVDYAHTPDALDNVLKTIAHVAAPEANTSSRWWAAEATATRPNAPPWPKRAAHGSDRVILTSDNPRSEDPAAILKEMEQRFGPH